MSDSPTALRIGVLAVVAMLALQLIWHAWLFPPSANLLSTLAMTTVPLVLSVWISISNRRRGVLIGGMLCLIYFSHGVTSAWSEPSTRLLALIEIALSLLIIGASGWDARHYRRKK
ncbi:MAG: DUF2069 domain-containing protein [Rudaea sp.]